MNLIYDLRYALRQLRKAPGFTVTAIVTLALGIGISAAMFTVIDGVLLRPLPVPHPDRVVALGNPQPGSKHLPGASSLPDLQDWRTQAKSFQSIAWYTPLFFNLKKPDGSTDFSINEQTSANFFTTLQATPALGRTFVPADRNGTGNPAVVSNFVWRTYLHSDPRILGKTLQIGSGAYTVIGVMPRHFYLPLNDDGPVVWTMLKPLPTMTRDSNFLNGIGRLRPGISAAAARAELSGIQANVVRRYANMDLDKRVAVIGLRELFVGSARSGLLALQGAVFLVWLIACANVAGLMLTRLSARRREIAVRAALGAGRGRIVRQFLTESLLIGAASGLLGYGVAVLCLRLLHHAIAANLSRAADVAINVPVILLLVSLSLLSAILFGTLPALQAASANPQDALHHGTLGAGSGLRQIRLRNFLIVGELALSLVLLFSAGLLLRTLYAMRHLDLGFNQHNLIDAMFFPINGFDIFEKSQPTINTVDLPVLERVRALPGVQRAAIVTRAPLSYQVNITDGFHVFGVPGREQHVELAFATPDAFQVLGIPLRQGRYFTEDDRPSTRAVAVVNEAFVREFLQGKSPLDQRLMLDDDPKDKSILGNVRIVGVIGDAPSGRVGEASIPMAYVDMLQMTPQDPMYPIASVVGELVVRTQRDPKAMIAAIRNIFTQVSPAVSVGSIQTYRQKIDGELGSQTLAARLLWIFAIAAVLISAAGLYGLLSYTVAQRTREIGVRIALGAQRADILRVVMRQAARLLGTGLALGMLAAFLLGHLLRSFLYGVSQHDGLTLLAVAAVLSLVGLLAAYVPARRAAAIEPTEALRTE
jgi:predicted permease